MTNRILSLVAAGVLMFGMNVFAQDQGSGGSMNKSANGANSSVSAKDKQFMTKAAQGGMAEVQLGELAQQKAESNDVKEFAQMLVTDHSKANDQLKSVAEQKGVTLPTDLDAKAKAEKDRLSKLSGDAVDRAFMRHEVMDHKKDIAEFKKESKMAKDNDVKEFATQALPTLQKHLDRAQQLAGSEKAESKGAMGQSKAKKSASMDKQ